MKIQMKYIFTGLLMFCALSSFAQNKLSLQDCRDKALEHNKEKKISRLMRGKANYDKKTYLAKFFPHIAADGNYMFTSKKFEKHTPELTIPTLTGQIPNITQSGFIHIPAYPLSLSLNKNWTAGVNITQPLYMGGRIRAAYKMSKIGEDMAHINEILTNNEVVYQTDMAYWNLLKVQELLNAALAYQKVVEHLMLDVENAFEVGMKSRNDVLKVKVKLNEAKLKTRRVENAIKLSKMNLCHIVGLPLLADVEINDSVINESSFASITIFDNIENRPEYQLLSKKLDLTKQEIKLARGEYLPQAGVRGGWNYYDALKFNDNSLIKGGSFSAIFSVSIPLFKWGEGVNKVRSMKVQHQMAELQRENISEKMQLEMTMALNQVDESSLEVEMTSEALKSATENLKTSKEHYEVGLETLTNFLEAQTLWHKASAEFIEAKAQLKLNETNYLKSSGQLYIE